MNSQQSQTPLPTFDSETVVPVAASPVERAKVCRPRREVLDHSGPRLTTETQALLRLRLRSAAFILFAGFTLFLVRNFVGAPTRGPFDPVLLSFHLLRQTCQGLREAHAIGLIHRDIKPGNIFAAQRGGLYDVAKLLDFGLVKPVAETASARLTMEGALSGTPLFMSPEQARGLHGLDARSDIYSLGAVGYGLLTGRPPFDGPNPLEVLIAHARDEAVPPSKLGVDVPADLEAVILRCLAKKPEDRFQDAESLELALAECSSADQWTQADAVRWWHKYETDQATVTPREINESATAGTPCPPTSVSGEADN